MRSVFGALKNDQLPISKGEAGAKCFPFERKHGQDLLLEEAFGDAAMRLEDFNHMQHRLDAQTAPSALPIQISR